MTQPEMQLHQEAEIQMRLATLEQLLRFFRPERTAHLFLSSASYVLLLGAAAMLIFRDKAGAAELSAIFGSSGLIAVSAGRLLHMWNQAFKVMYDNND